MMAALVLLLAALVVVGHNPMVERVRPGYDGRLITLILLSVIAASLVIMLAKGGVA